MGYENVDSALGSEAKRLMADGWTEGIAKMEKRLKRTDQKASAAD